MPERIILFGTEKKEHVALVFKKGAFPIHTSWQVNSLLAAGAVTVALLHGGHHPDAQAYQQDSAPSNSATVPDTFRPGTTTPLHDDSPSGMELVAPDGTVFNRVGPASWNSTHNQKPETFPNGGEVPNPLAPGTCDIEGAGAGSNLQNAKIICSLPPTTTRADFKLRGLSRPVRTDLARKVRMDAPRRTSFQTRRI